ncbi:adenylate cyclase 1 [Methyloglobulus morosus KoM1]|uniref:Adenylate cyclase 1 n=1 Tax=Methyloglobulus morosus KoM1 TaxID=1116472 RepID=V5BJ97_9GAMM|nr:adenylate/guanylate cyclase domain-containing protein [Methyloglobulus morosus]ESS73390.1 adenylate cyclase 1 [Methyloglobulus morosus KoM1]
MTRQFPRATLIALVTFLLGTGVYYLTSLETSLGLDTLFQLRGVRPPPPEVVVVAMDEESETRLGVGQDLTRWRSYHAKLIQELQRQGAALVVFDLQFITPHIGQDSTLASAMKSAGNVLIADCLQKINSDDKEFSGREECSERHNALTAEEENGQTQQPGEQGVLLMHKIRPAAILARTALDHAPFSLPNDAGNPTIRAVWPFLDMFKESPTLPVLAWLYYLQDKGVLEGVIQSDRPFSTWLTKQRKQCFSDEQKNLDILPSPSDLEITFNTLICHEDGQYLDYYGPPQTFKMVSYSDVYQGKVSDLEGKVVFIGKSNRKFSPGKTDVFQTPFTDTRSGRMSGVEIMATEFSNFLEDRFIRPPFPAVLVILFFGLAVALVLTQFAGLSGIVASLALFGAYTGMALWGFSRSGLWLPIAVPLIQLPLSWLMSLLWSRWDLLDERKRILAFVRQVFPQWLPYISASPGEWYPDKGAIEPKSEQDVNGLCLATDIEGYTSVAAQHTPREMWALLNDYYQVLGYPVSSNNGIIADITGDAMMAVWMDATKTTQRLSACFAALEMELAVDKFNEATVTGRLPTRIGLHEGDMTLGRIEAGEGSYYRAIGDTINTASRIQGVNKYLGTRILASAAISTGITNVIYRPVGAFRLVGRTEPLELVEIVGMSADIKKIQFDLHQQFALGLNAFRLGLWDKAETIFQTVLDNYGQDGPSEFFLEFMASFQGNPPPGWEGIVTLQAK